MCVVFLNKLKPDGREFCSQPGLKFSPVNSLKSQLPMSSAYSPRRSLTAGLQMVSRVGISKSKNKRRRKRSFQTQGFSGRGRLSPSGALILGLHLEFVSWTGA